MFFSKTTLVLRLLVNRCKETPVSTNVQYEKCLEPNTYGKLVNLNGRQFRNDPQDSMIKWYIDFQFCLYFKSKTIWRKKMIKYHFTELWKVNCSHSKFNTAIGIIGANSKHWHSNQARKLAYENEFLLDETRANDFNFVIFFFLNFVIILTRASESTHIN